MNDPHSTDEGADRSATLADDEIETRPLGSAGTVPGDDTGDTGDTGDDTGDPSDASDTGDDSGDSGDSADDSGTA